MRFLSSKLGKTHVNSPVAVNSNRKIKKSKIWKFSLAFIFFMCYTRHKILCNRGETTQNIATEGQNGNRTIK